MIPRWSITLFLSLLGTSVAQAFDIAGNKWAGGTVDYYVALDGTSLTGIRWQDAFLDALDEWNRETVFNFVPVQQYSDPCSGNTLSSVDFTDDVCGSEFGENTLAVTLRRLQATVLGPPNLIEADIVVNSEVNYNIYDGPIPQFGIPGLDFRRVALHELGHAIGLDHESSAPAIMAPNIGNLDRLQADDIAGVNALYGGLNNCEIRPLAFGVLTDALEASDCTVSELTAGGQDSSFIDVYQLEVLAFTNITLEMTSPTLDSVLLLADSSLDIFAFDNKTSGSCNSTLSRFLFPGNYFVLTNTYDFPVRDDCGNIGDYTLTAAYSATSIQALGGVTSLLGDVSGASFRGGVTASGGSSFGNRFRPDQSLDVLAEIQIDPIHRGQPGFLVVAALLGDEILLQDASGNFAPYDPAQPITRILSKTLGTREAITIFDDLVPEELGIDSISVDFVVGYGLESGPGEVYYHQRPINLTVVP
jgi:hypothetical protein